jgi:hypothetical protein
MKQRDGIRIRKITAMLFTSALLLGFEPKAFVAAAQNIVQNGSFEQVTYVPLRIDPWVPVRWSALLGNWDNAPDGVNYILVDTIYQDLLTAPGQQYTLNFNVAADLYSEPSARLRVLWGGASVATETTQPHLYNPQQNRYEQIVWESFSLSVVAGGPTTRLEFESADGTDYLFDNVRVTVVPEPSPLPLAAVALCVLASRELTLLLQWTRRRASVCVGCASGGAPLSSLVNQRLV